MTPPSARSTLTNWSKVRRKPPGWSGLEYFSHGERQRKQGFCLAKRWLWGDLIATCPYLWGSLQDHVAIGSGRSSTSQGVVLQHENKRHCQIKMGYKETLFSNGDRQTMEEVTQRGCACSILGGFHDMTEQSPEQKLSWLCFEQEVGLQTSWGTSPPKWFCKIESLMLNSAYIEEKCCLVLNLPVTWENYVWSFLLSFCTDNVIFDAHTVFAYWSFRWTYTFLLFTNVVYLRIHVGHSRRCWLVRNSSFRAPVYIHIPCTFSLQSFKMRVLGRGSRVKDNWPQEALLWRFCSSGGGCVSEWHTISCDPRNVIDILLYIL